MFQHCNTYTQYINAHTDDESLLKNSEHVGPNYFQKSLHYLVVHWSLRSWENILFSMDGGLY